MSIWKLVEIRIFYGIIFLFFISTATAFAQPELSVQTDDNRYDDGDTIVISGNVGIVIGKTPVLIQSIHDGAIIEIAQITVAQDGSFTKTVLAEKTAWKNEGEYLVKAF